MKAMVLFGLLALSFSSLAGHHFECHPKTEPADGQRVTFLLVPNLADLTSGATFSQWTQEKYRHFEFEKQMNLGSKRLVLSEKETNSLIIVTGDGVVRNMVILSLKGTVLEQYTCFQESSI